MTQLFDIQKTSLGEQLQKGRFNEKAALNAIDSLKSGALNFASILRQTAESENNTDNQTLRNKSLQNFDTLVNQSSSQLFDIQTSNPFLQPSPPSSDKNKVPKPLFDQEEQASLNRPDEHHDRRDDDSNDKVSRDDAPVKRDDLSDQRADRKVHDRHERADAPTTGNHINAVQQDETLQQVETAGNLQELASAEAIISDAAKVAEVNVDTVALPINQQVQTNNAQAVAPQLDQRGVAANDLDRRSSLIDESQGGKSLSDRLVAQKGVDKLVSDHVTQTAGDKLITDHVTQTAGDKLITDHVTQTADEKAVLDQAAAEDISRAATQNIKEQKAVKQGPAELTAKYEPIQKDQQNTSVKNQTLVSLQEEFSSAKALDKNQVETASSDQAQGSLVAQEASKNTIGGLAAARGNLTQNEQPQAANNPSNQNNSNGSAQQQSQNGQQNKSGDQGRPQANPFDQLARLDSAQNAKAPQQTIPLNLPLLGEDGLAIGQDPTSQNPNVNGTESDLKFRLASERAQFAGRAEQSSRPTPQAQIREQVSIQIKQAVEQGQDQINIKLNPAHLGKLDVKLSIVENGSVSALIQVEKPETLELLKQDKNQLIAALEEAGLTANSSDLEFSLSQDQDTAHQFTKNPYAADLARIIHESRELDGQDASSSVDDKANDIDDNDQEHNHDAILGHGELPSFDENGHVNVRV